MRAIVLAIGFGGLLLASTALAQQSTGPDERVKVQKTMEAFVAEFEQLLKKYPEARQSFVLNYQAPGRRDVQVRCAPSCDWYADSHLCACRPPHGELLK